MKENDSVFFFRKKGSIEAVFIGKGIVFNTLFCV